MRYSGIARLENARQVFHRLGVALHRPEVALRDHARHVLVGRRLHPDRVAVEQQQVVRLGLGDDAAADGHHHLGVRLDDAFEAAALDAAVARLPVEEEDLGQADAGLALDLAVELDEGAAAVFRERRAERRLAGAAQADERDPLLARGLFVAEVAHQAEHDVLEAMLGQALEEAADQPLLDRALLRVEELRHRNAERARNAAQQQDRRVAFAGFELGEIALRHVRVLRQDLPRHPAALARLADVPAHRHQEFGVVRLLGGIVRRGGDPWFGGGHGRAGWRGVTGNIMHVQRMRQELYVKVACAGNLGTLARFPRYRRSPPSASEWRIAICCIVLDDQFDMI